MQPLEELKQQIHQTVRACYPEAEWSGQAISLQQTRPEFTGEYTLVTFPLAKLLGDKPPQIAERLGSYLLKNYPEVSAFEVVKGFLNLKMKASFWGRFLAAYRETDFRKAFQHTRPQTVMVEYSSPNTNKPLHLGHIRNNLLGYSVAEVLRARGHRVIKANLINDRGIHICKSMLAYQRFGQGETPASTGEKGDHMVGRYYVRFDQEYRREMQALVSRWVQEDEVLGHMGQDPADYLKSLSQKGQQEDLTDAEKEEIKRLKGFIERAEREAPLMIAAQEMLQRWERGDPETVSLWKTMNQWVYEGFESTYRRLGVDFDVYYYESDTYLLGKDIVQEGLKQGVFLVRDDGSVWADLQEEGLDQKLLLRRDGTSVYITQDLGTAELKYQDYKLDQSIYVVGNEQEYHFKVLQALLKKLGKPYADGIFHLSYGMVDLPHGKMKSREGTVVDADDLITEVSQTAARYSEESGKIADLEAAEKEQLYEAIGLGALKFFLLKTEPKKRLLFNPHEEIDFQGHTGPFVQYTHARICSVMRKYQQEWGVVRLPSTDSMASLALDPTEIELLRMLAQLPEVLQEAEQQMNPASLANHAFELAKNYNRFYHQRPILKEPHAELRAFRAVLSDEVRRTLLFDLTILGIEAPEAM